MTTADPPPPPPSGQQARRQTRWLSKGLTDLWRMPEMGPVPYWDVIIVGSGYGGSVAAQSLANQLITEENDKTKNRVTRPLRVCLLERGQEYLPGAFPSRFADLPGHVRITQQGSALPSGNREGLFDLRLGGDVSALVANGLGGGSLINAAVLARPDFRDETSGLPLSVRRVLTRIYLERAAQLLGGGTDAAPNRIDGYRTTQAGQSPVAKTAALRDFSGTQQFSLARIAVSMVNAPNCANVQQKECTLCGDCMTGCNVDAKNSLDTNLLAKAAQGGVQIFTGASVLKLARDELDRDGLDGVGGLWSVTVVHTDNRLQAKEEAPLVLKASRVILAAGTLGSTEILLRSQSERTVFSSRLGARFSCNGDNLAVIYDSPNPVNGVADEETAAGDPDHSRRVGPTITGSVKMAYESATRPEFLIQEFSVPGPLNRFFSETVTTANTIYGLSDADETIHGLCDPVNDPHAVDAARIRNSLLVGLIGHDEAQGRISLPSVPTTRYDRNEQEGSVRISWPSLKNSPLIEQAYERLERLIAATPGKRATTRLIANPMWRLLPPSLADLVSQPRGPLLTVHPLGGCCMDTPTTNGVVDQYGRVHNLARLVRAGNSCANDWFGTLVVLDGSIVPGSLGANPALTITALSLRAMRALRRRWHITPNNAAVQAHAEQPRERPRFVPHRLPASAPVTSTEIEVVERLSGQMRLHIGETQPVNCVVELSLAYQSKRVCDLTTVLKRTLVVDPNNPLTRLRIYRASTWQQQNLDVASDEKRKQHLLFESELSGSLSFFHRDTSMPVCRGVNSLWAYAWNRGSRDFWQYGREKVRQRMGIDPATPSGVDFWARLFNAVALSTRAGEVRLFEYQLVVGQATGGNLDLIAQGRAIKGYKRLTYNRRANPWQQLMELRIDRFPGLCTLASPVLKLDTRFLAKQGAPLLRISRQQDQVHALAELTSLGLVLARVLLSTHLWTFRKPDMPSRSEPERLPGNIVGLPEPEIIELDVGWIPNTTQPVIVRLTRYPRPRSTKPPLAMIHGYSVSGNTFTHPAIDRSAAQHFWHAGRDVWVVDLRTSSGLPTATYPWAMEDAALVDIPAALLYIRQVTGKNVDVLAHCIGAVMLSMALLADAKKIRSGQTELGVDSRLTPRQLGQLASFNERATPGAAHPCIGKIVLSQKGPLLRYSDANIFRSYVLGFLRRALVGAGYQFRAPAKPTVADQLLDRLLASIPYPRSDYDIENPLAPWKTTPWVGSRHRMDALYARDFSAKNLNHATLNAIDDLFGPINADTVAQTMHFARFCRATNQRGRGEFVTLGNLRERWGGIPTLAIHGDDNGLVDVSTQSLLGVNFTAAGVPFACKSYRGLGHQDVLIGKSSSVVFNDIEDFLNHPPQRNSANTSDLQQWFLDVPWMGPRLRVPLVGETLSSSIACMSSPAFGESTLMLIPVDNVMQLAAGVNLVTGDTSRNGAWLFARPPVIGADVAPLHGWIAVLAYRASEITLSEQEQVAGDNTPQQPGTPRAPRVGRAVIPDPTTYSHLVVGKHSTQFASILESAANLSTGTNQLAPDTEPGVEVLQDWLQYMHQHRPNDLAKCLVRRDDWVRAISRKSVGKKSELRFALGSCQYPAGLLDKRVALASLARLGGELDKRDFVIFAGDQIYADATAGLLDPTRRDELFDQPYEAALRKPAMRRVLSRVPVYMLLDDHEIRDNWEPVATPARRLNDPREDEDVLNNGVAAYMHYQRMHERNNASRVIGFQVSHALAEFYFLDARTQRELRSSTTLGSANIISQQQLNDLRVWLEANANKPKFIVTASLFLPRRLAVAQTPSDAAHSDAWDGYSASIASVLQIIVTAKVKNVVFLSGDEHHSMFAETRLVDTSAPGSEPIEITTVHSSGLYAPFPFANGAPQDFEAIDVLNFGTWTATTVTRFAPGDGFAQIRLRRENGAWTLNVDFKKPGGATVSFNTRLA